MDKQDNNPKDTKKTQDHSGGQVREGQEDSSILHDKKDPNKELVNVTEEDIKSTSQEEFINDDENTNLTVEVSRVGEVFVDTLVQSKPVGYLGYKPSPDFFIICSGRQPSVDDLILLAVLLLSSFVSWS